MTDQIHVTQPGPASLASSLFATLKEEHEALVRLRGHFDEHIGALRRREKERIDDATHRTNDEVHTLARLKQARDRKLRLLGRVLRLEPADVHLEEVANRLASDRSTAEAAEEILHLREAIRTEAARTQRRCRDLEFALEYAVHLGRELLQTLQGDPPVGSTKVYTARGGAVESSGSSSLVNRIG